MPAFPYEVATSMQSQAATPLVPEIHNAHPAYRPDIDGLRAVAILSVVIFHAFPSKLRGGFVGVDIFFVISGFLISSIIFRSLQRGDFNFAEFYAHRVKRIFPALIVVLAASYAYGWFTLLPEEFKQLGKHTATGVSFIQNFVLWQEAGYFDSASELKPLMHLWSLAIEEQFYLFYPVLIWGAWRLGLNVLTAVAFLFLVSFGLNISGIGTDAVKTFFVPQTRFWELFAGSVLAYLQLSKRTEFADWLKRWAFHPLVFRHPPLSTHRNQILNNIISALGLLLIASAVIGIHKGKPFPGWWALTPVIGAFLTILAGPDAWLNRKVLANRLMVFIGLISYPLYLWHWPILSFLRIMELETPSPALRTGAVALSILLAWLTYRLIERPIRFNMKSRAKVFFLSVLAIIIGCIGYLTYQLNGLPFRFPNEIQHIVDFKYDFRTDARVGKCWLSGKQPYDGFTNQCIETSPSGDKRSIFVWGDSHAARLYPGLRAIIGDRSVISQLTRDGCPPILGFGYAVCQESNEYVISEIKKHRPATVVMFAAWYLHQSDWISQSAAKQGLLDSIHRLKSLGVKKIIVLGPTPAWNDALPKIVYKSWKQSYPIHKIPERLMIDMNPDAVKVDKELEEMLGAEPVRYVSALNIMCSKEGCLTHTPNRPEELFTWDYGHLTTEGAVFVSQYLSTHGVLP